MPKVTVPEAFDVVAKAMRAQAIGILEDSIKSISALDDTLGSIAAHCHQFADEDIMMAAFASLADTKKILGSACEELRN